MDKNPMEQAGGLIAPDDLRRSIDHWLTDGVITPEQAAIMREDVLRENVAATAEQPIGSLSPATAPEPAPSAPVAPLVAPHHPEHRTSLLIEALGYLGGVIILTAFILVLSQFWEDFTAPVRLASIGAAFVLLLAAGFVVPQSLGGPGIRLRSVLWLGATMAWAGVLGFTANEYLDLIDEQLVLFTAGITLPLAGVLWLLHRQPLQHLAFFASIVAVAGSGAAMLPEPSAIIAPDAKIGAMVWGVSVAWFLLAWGGIVKPRGLGFALGSIVAVFAAMTTMGGELESQSRPGAVLLLITLAALVIAAVLFRDFMLLVIAAIGSLQGMPIAMSVFFPGVLWAAFALLVIGAALIAAAIVIARSRRRERAVSHRNWSIGSQPAAITSAGLVLVGTAATVVTTSLIA
jgi:hypothetical protein